MYTSDTIKNAFKQKVRVMRPILYYGLFMLKLWQKLKKKKSAKIGLFIEGQGVFFYKTRKSSHRRPGSLLIEGQEVLL